MAGNRISDDGLVWSPSPQRCNVWSVHFRPRSASTQMEEPEGRSHLAVFSTSWVPARVRAKASRLCYPYHLHSSGVLGGEFF